MIGDHLGQADHGQVHLVVLQTFFQNDAAVGASRDHAVRLEGLELGDFLTLKASRRSASPSSIAEAPPPPPQHQFM
jgi:hypothetical protein